MTRIPNLPNLGRDDVDSAEDYYVVRDGNANTDKRTPAGSAGGRDVGTGADQVPTNSTVASTVETAVDNGAWVFEQPATYVDADTLTTDTTTTDDAGEYVYEVGRRVRFLLETSGTYHYGVIQSIASRGTSANVTIASGTDLANEAITVWVHRDRASDHLFYDVRWLGAVGDGVTDDTASISAAISVAGAYGTVVFPGGSKSFLVTSELVQLTGQKWIFEGGQRASKILKGFNGNAVRTATLGRMISPFVDGQGGTYTGTNFLIKTGEFSQYLENVRTVSSQGPGILYETNAGGGNRINGIEGDTVDPENVGVIALTEDTTAVARFWNNLWLAGGVIDIRGGGNGLAISDFYVRNILTGYAGSVPTRSGLYKVSNGRFANLGNTLVITAVNGSYNNVSMAANVILDDCQGVKFTPTCTFTTIVENTNSRFNSFFTQSAAPYSVVWSAPDGSVGNIGNGTLEARFARKGHFVKIQVYMVFGSTTVQPSGGSAGWRFSLPFPGAIFFTQRGLPCEVEDGSNTITVFGQIPSDASYIQFVYNGQIIRNGYPSSWASGDGLIFNIEYEAR